MGDAEQRPELAHGQVSALVGGHQQYPVGQAELSWLQAGEDAIHSDLDAELTCTVTSSQLIGHRVA
ncbi:hypothetical protein GCM10010185_27270 [Saccharothrix coeruleofusca]|uniref:Uncharacterized protein n=1 Tax=Saccharothrix coeruleofusca TaxID=33919 RepID=A0A918APB6_9PSEU|nr:hypothetical protein GCM10010185_27270 [Saccharothrix coeruleofusca]